LGIEPEDVHGPTKVVLQRQFFEAIVRAAYVKYKNSSELPTLADKLDHMFKHKLVPNATKTKIKSSDEEKNFKLAEGVIDEYEQLWTVFEYFGKQTTTNNLHKDASLTVGDLVNMFRKAKILDTDRISMCDFIDIVEKYHANGSGQKLCEKLSKQCFEAYAKANAHEMQINKDIDAINKHNAVAEAHNEKCAQQQESENPPQPMELKELPSEDEVRERTDAETQQMHADWQQRTIAEHVMWIKGAEIVYFEFKEIIFDMARKLKDQVDPKTGKMTNVLKKFIDEWLLRRLTSFVKFKIPANPIKGKEAARTWPESQKDAVIREKQALMAEEEAARIAAEEEKARLEAEAREQAEEQEPEIDPAELAEMQRKQAEEEEAARIAREAAEEAALVDQESSGSDDMSDDSASSNNDVEESF